jgi:Bacteriophage lambda head decoration protein D
MSASVYPIYDGLGNMPGVSTVLESVENQFWYGRMEDLEVVPAVIDGTARDTGNTGNTTRLRPGLLLGIIAATGKYTNWNPNATDGSSRIAGVLGGLINAQRGGSNADSFFYVIRRGPLRASGLIVPGTTNPGIVGNPLEWLIVNGLLENECRLDRFYNTLSMTRGYAADATLVAADLNLTITNLGAAGNVTLTLPAPLRGAKLRAINTAGNSLILSAGASNFLGLGATATLTPAGDSLEILGVATAIGSPDTVRWAVVSNNGAAFT